MKKIQLEIQDFWKETLPKVEKSKKEYGIYLIRTLTNGD